MISTKIVYDHRGRTDKSNAGPLEVRVTIDRKPYYVNTGVKVLRTEWKYDSVVNRVDSQELNDRLVIILRKVEQEINEYLSNGRIIDVAAIRRKVNDVVKRPSIHPENAVFLDWMDEQIELLGVAPGTKKHYNTLSYRLHDFGLIRTWDDVSVEAILNFDIWLHNIGNAANSSLQKAHTEKSEKKISDAGIYNYHKCLKALLNRAELMNKIEKNPYSKLKGKIKRGEKENIEYLTEDEMNRIEALDIEDGTLIRKAKDLFVFQMYTGMAYADSQAFDIDNYKMVDGKWINRQQRIKTGVPFLNQLLPPVVAVLEHYGMVVPKIDAADYNHALKIIGAAVGIKTNMHSHLARHTFATFMLKNGVKIENLQKMLGHKSIVTTQRYAKVLAQSVQDDFDMVADKINKKG